MATDPLRAGPEPRGGYANVHPPAGGKPRQAPPPPPGGVRGQQVMTLFRGNEGVDAGVSMATERRRGGLRTSSVTSTSRFTPAFTKLQLAAQISSN